MSLPVVGSDNITAVQLQCGKRCNGAPGEEPPSTPRLASPDDLGVHHSSIRDTHGVGHNLHRTETCDTDQPDLMTQVVATPATMPGCVMGPAGVHNLAARDLLPGTHLLDRS